MQSVRIGVIGIGNMGKAHAECIYQDKIRSMELVAVCDNNAKKLHDFIDSHPGITTYENASDMLKNKDIDAVIIAVPHRLHAEIAVMAFECDKHVLVEKPIDITVSQAMRLNDAAEKSGKVFGIMFNQRTNPLFKKARELVKNGELGEIKDTTWIVTNWFRTQSYYNSGDWRATWAGEGGGVLLNQAPHQLDMWQWICGMPESVTAYCSTGLYHNIEVEDSAKIFIRYKNGAQGVFITSTGEYPGTNRLEISGDKGKLVLENSILKFWRLNESVNNVCRNSAEYFTTIPYDYCEFTQEEPETGHMGILENFASAIIDGTELIAPGTEGINELMLSNAAYMSEWKNNTSVKIPFDADEFDALLSEKIKSSQYVCRKSSTYIKPHETQREIYNERWRVKWE